MTAPGFTLTRAETQGELGLSGRTVSPAPTAFGVDSPANPCADCIDVHGDTRAAWLAKWPAGAEWNAEYGAFLCDGCADDRAASYCQETRALWEADDAQ